MLFENVKKGGLGLKIITCTYIFKGFRIINASILITTYS